MKIEDSLTKRYYTMREVCQLIEVAPSLIRHWETVFGRLHTRRDGKGGRRFTPEDIHHLAKIYTLVKEKGYTLEGAREAIDRRGSNNKAIVTELTAIRDGLVAIKNDLDKTISGKE